MKNVGAFWVPKRNGNKEANKSKWASNHIPALSEYIYSNIIPIYFDTQTNNITFSGGLFFVTSNRVISNE